VSARDVLREASVPSMLVTIDTEPDCDTRWARSSPLAFTSVTDGIPRLLRPIWDRTRLKPLYFVSPEVLEDDASCRVLRDEAERGAILGAHLHSEYVPPAVTVPNPAGVSSAEFPCYAHATEIERAKIETLTARMEERLGSRPIWYRAARFGADLDSLRSLAALGYRYDSSVTPAVSWATKRGPDHSKAPLQPYWVGRDDLYAPVERETSLGVLEVPVTILGRRFGPLGPLLPENWMAYRWLRPSVMTGLELRGVVDEMVVRFERPQLVMMFHSMEIMPGRSPYVRTAFGQQRFLRRLESVLEYAASRGC
jgi:hypothetical protein